MPMNRFPIFLSSMFLSSLCSIRVIRVIRGFDCFSPISAFCFLLSDFDYEDEDETPLIHSLTQFPISLRAGGYAPEATFCFLLSDFHPHAP